MMHIKEEAARCLLCNDAPCSKACKHGDPARAIRAIRFDNEQLAGRWIAACTDEELEAMLSRQKDLRPLSLSPSAGFLARIPSSWLHRLSARTTKWWHVPLMQAGQAYSTRPSACRRYARCRPASMPFTRRVHPISMPSATWSS